MHPRKRGPLRKQNVWKKRSGQQSESSDITFEELNAALPDVLLRCIHSYLPPLPNGQANKFDIRENAVEMFFLHTNVVVVVTQTHIVTYDHHARKLHQMPLVGVDETTDVRFNDSGVFLDYPDLPDMIKPIANFTIRPDGRIKPINLLLLALLPAYDYVSFVATQSHLVLRDDSKHSVITIYPIVSESVAPVCHVCQTQVMMKRVVNMVASDNEFALYDNEELEIWTLSPYANVYKRTVTMTWPLGQFKQKIAVMLSGDVYVLTGRKIISSHRDHFAPWQTISASPFRSDPSHGEVCMSQCNGQIGLFCYGTFWILK